MKVATIVLILVFFARVPGIAGTTGVMHGYVRDKNGQPVADALVSVASPSETAETYTDKHGFYVFLSLPPDVYTVWVKKDETSNAYAIGARVNSDQTTFLNFRFTSWTRCPAPTLVTLAANQGSDQFWSLDVQRIEEYPPNVAPPILLPPVPIVRLYGCL